MKKMLIILFLSPLFLFAQEVGIHFEHNTDWQKVKEKAKAEDKFIFVDCYTTWCGPCIWMADNVFPVHSSLKIILMLLKLLYLVRIM